MFNHYVIRVDVAPTAREECLFSRVSEEHKHRSLSEDVSVFTPTLHRLCCLCVCLCVFTICARYSVSSKDSPRCVSKDWETDWKRGGTEGGGRGMGRKGGCVREIAMKAVDRQAKLFLQQNITRLVFPK